ncbi:hypothetical protein HL668_32225 [Bradyrhizobium sp. 81013]|nr:hypothetical protein [Bradyrhizobium aeschynomenes]
MQRRKSAASGAIQGPAGQPRHVRVSPFSDLSVAAKDVRLLGLIGHAYREQRRLGQVRATDRRVLVPMRQKPHFTRSLKHITPVQSSREKYSPFAFPKIMIV